MSSCRFICEVELKIRPGRKLALVFEFEDRDGIAQSAELVFTTVVQYRVTYLYALRPEWIHEAYDRLVELPNSTELESVKTATAANNDSAQYSHFRVCFDDGPCFDIICSSFKFLAGLKSV